MITKPTINLTEDQIAQATKLAELGCNDVEIYSFIGIKKTTFYRLKGEPALEAALAGGRARLNVKLRRMQIEMAMAGSVPLLVHLGKSMLGQGNQPPVQAEEANPLTAFLPRAETLKNLPRGSDE